MAHEPCLAPATALPQPTAQRTPHGWSVAEAGAAFYRVLYKFCVIAVLH